MEILKSISIDISEKQNAPVVYAVQGEKNSRKIRVSMFQNGVAWIPDTESNVLISYKKSDGRGGMYDRIENGEFAFEYDGQNVLTIILAEQVLTTPGKVSLLVSFASDDVVSSTFPIEINVSENPGIDVAESNDYFNLSFISLFTVTISKSEDGYVADKRFSEIKFAWEQGRYCVCLWDGLILPMILIGAGAEFEAVWSGQLYSVKISQSNKVKTDVSGIDGGNGGGGVFTVTYTDNEDEYKRIDKTVEEIYEAADKGMLVRCETGYGWAYLESWGKGSGASFSYFGFYGYTNVWIDGDGAAHLFHYDRLTKMRGIPITIDDDGNAYAECDLTNSELWDLYIGRPPEVLPYIDLYDATYDLSIYLPNVRQEEVYIDDVAAWCIRYTFSKTLQPGEGREKAVRYTVRLVSGPDDGSSDPDGEPLVEYSVEELDDNIIPIATPDTLGGVKPVAKSADMTQSVGVDATGRLWTEPSGEGGGSSEVVLIDYTAEEPVSMVDIPITEEMKTAIADATCIRWRLTLSGDETATDTTGYGSAELMFWCGWSAGTLLPTTAECVPSAENKSWAVGNISGYIFKSPAISNLGIESSTGLKNNTMDLHLSCFCRTTGPGKIPTPSFNTTLIVMPSADMVLRLTTSLPIGTGSRIILTVS